MEGEFDQAMKNLSDEELFNVLNSNPGDYRDDAMVSAKNEFQRRNLSQVQIDAVNQQIESNRFRNESISNEPLNIIWKLLAFIFPGIMHIAFAGVLKIEGYDRKFKEFTQWTIYGIIFYGIIVAFMVISQIFIMNSGN